LKKAFFLILVICICKTGFAQTDTSLLYIRFPFVPPFKITKVSDSTAFTKDDLDKKKATIIMVFSPDCEHCQHETNELIAHINLFKKAQIIMATPMEHAYIKKFYNDYKIADYPNIIMGRDPGYYLGTFYHIRSFPAIFVYDKKGNFVKAFDGSYPVEQIAEAL
jgi:thioredoxin-related protein